MSTINVTLAGQTYAVSKLNIGQLRRVAKVFAAGTADAFSFDVLRIAFERAEPKVADIEELEADFEEFTAAVEAILSAAGLKRDAVPNEQGRTAIAQASS